MSPLQAEFAGVARQFADQGLSISDMIQALYEQQRHWKRNNGRPVADNVNERPEVTTKGWYVDVTSIDYYPARFDPDTKERLGKAKVWQGDQSWTVDDFINNERITNDTTSK